jgi:hypothetical protein
MEDPMMSALFALALASLALMVMLLRAWRKLEKKEFVNIVHTLALDFAAEQIATLKHCKKESVLQDLIASGVYGYSQYDPDVFMAISRPIFDEQAKALTQALSSDHETVGRS